LYCCSIAGTEMAQSAPLILHLVASSITAVNRAGKIIRDVMSKGDLGIVEKVGRRVHYLQSTMYAISRKCAPFLCYTYFNLTALCGSCVADHSCHNNTVIGNLQCPCKSRILNTWWWPF
jgi:hypothetical protein